MGERLSSAQQFDDWLDTLYAERMPDAMKKVLRDAFFAGWNCGIDFCLARHELPSAPQAEPEEGS